jgi:hypothetical protein
MERRDQSLKALKELQYIDSLDESERAKGLERWAHNYLMHNEQLGFDLEQSELLQLQELYYKNIEFMKSYSKTLQSEMLENKKMKAFLQNS